MMICRMSAGVNEADEKANIVHDGLGVSAL
jgi:hypothetical protein